MSTSITTMIRSNIRTIYESTGYRPSQVQLGLHLFTMLAAELEHRVFGFSYYRGYSVDGVPVLYANKPGISMEISVVEDI